MIIPGFKPAVSYRELNIILARILFNNAPDGGVSVFEHKFAQYLGVKHAIGVPSGRWGLCYILQGLGLQKGDEVILPAFTYFAVPAVIIKLGLTPVFVDINTTNFNIDVGNVREHITSKTRAIIPTHLCGFACEMDKLLDISRKYNIAIIEDCAQSLGAAYKNKKMGSWGDAAYFTFGITKNFTTLGSGIAVTNNEELANSIRNSIRKISPTGMDVLFFEILKAYIMKFATSSILFPGVYSIMRMCSFFGIDIIASIFHEKNSVIGNLPNSGQLNNMQVELGIMQLNDLDRKNELRMQLGLELYGRLSDADNVQIPLLEKDAKNIFSTCPISVKNKNEIKRKLLKNGIDVSAGYLQDCSKLELFKEFRKRCPNASRAEEEVIYLPVYSGLRSTDLIFITETIKGVSK